MTLRKEPGTPGDGIDPSAAMAVHGAPLGRAPSPPLTVGKTTRVRNAVRAFLSAELQARETRVTKVAPDGTGGWDVEAAILVLDLSVKRLGLRLSQEILEEQHCAVQLDGDLNVQSYELFEEGDR